MEKTIARAFYTSQQWRRCRQAYIKSVGGLCEECLARGILSPIDEVHHIIKLTPDNINNPDIALNFENLQGLCKNCHLEEHKKKKQHNRFSVDENGRVVAIEGFGG